jgi:FMN-dependent NADH-azoreductase
MYVRTHINSEGMAMIQTASTAAATVAARRLLHIAASPRGEAAESRRIAETFLQTFADARPDIEIETFDLWDGTLPPFGPDAAAAKMSVFAGADPEGSAARAWSDVIDTFRRFDSADRYLFSVPMWNAGVPYILKQFIDVVSQPGMVFGFDPHAGYTGLLRGKKAAVIYTSAVYGPDRSSAFGTDFQRTFFDDWLRWAGITDISEISFRPNLATDDADTGRQLAHATAREIAKSF